jgi:HD-GYP domain-containing protein (c-di-GMP phosphodiesterase class II)
MTESLARRAPGALRALPPPPLLPPTWRTASALRGHLARRLADPADLAAIFPAVAALLADHHPALARHSLRVARHLAHLAPHLPDPVPPPLAALGALLHDLGKLLVPLPLLLAPRALSIAETEVLQRHPVLGLGLLPPGLDLVVTDAVAHHHERWDGRGYPLGLCADRTPAIARLLAVVDAHDAMTHPRPYRPALTPQAARVELQDAAGAQLDPRLVALFLDFPLPSQENHE